MYSTVPPWLRLKAVTHWRFNGRTRPGISAGRLRSGIRRVPFTEPSHQTGSSLGDFHRGVSSSLPYDMALEYHSFAPLSKVILQISARIIHIFLASDSLRVGATLAVAPIPPFHTNSVGCRKGSPYAKTGQEKPPQLSPQRFA